MIILEFMTRNVSGLYILTHKFLHTKSFQDIHTFTQIYDKSSLHIDQKHFHIQIIFALKKISRHPLIIIEHIGAWQIRLLSQKLNSSKFQINWHPKKMAILAFQPLFTEIPMTLHDFHNSFSSIDVRLKHDVIDLLVAG